MIEQHEHTNKIISFKDCEIAVWKKKARDQEAIIHSLFFLSFVLSALLILSIAIILIH